MRIKSKTQSDFGTNILLFTIISNKIFNFAILLSWINVYSYWTVNRSKIDHIVESKGKMCITVP